MSDEDEDYRSMCITVRDVLQDDRPRWEPEYPKMVADFVALDTGLKGLDALTAKTATEGFTNARGLAEQVALTDVMVVVQGIKAVYLDGKHPELAGLAELTRTAVDILRDTKQVDKMRDILKVAGTIKPELADERVKDKHLEKADESVEALSKLVGKPRKQTIDNAALTQKEKALIEDIKAAISNLDTRVPNLKEDLPDVVQRYKKARKVIKVAGRKKDDDGEDGAK